MLYRLEKAEEKEYEIRIHAQLCLVYYSTALFYVHARNKKMYNLSRNLWLSRIYVYYYNWILSWHCIMSIESFNPTHRNLFIIAIIQTLFNDSL
jgi:hypothetical protein